MDPIYIEKFVPDPDEAFAALKKLDWERRSDAPRSGYYCNDYNEPYTYGRGAGRRTYEPRYQTEAIWDVRHALEKQCGCVFDTVFLNRYLNQSDHLGWHSDDSPEMDDARPVVSVSLGVEREIWIRPKPFSKPVTEAKPWTADFELHATQELKQIRKFSLAHGSAFIMPPGFQDLYQHKIPKASFQCGERVSLTFRGYIRADHRT